MFVSAVSRSRALSGSRLLLLADMSRREKEGRCSAGAWWNRYAQCREL